jgi:hypothetical protein
MPNWNLYWVESDGLEDCFVVARNSRSARRVEIDMNGFEPKDVQATKIVLIPQSVEESYNKKKKQNGHSWPWYVYGRSFFKAIGAQFRVIEGKEEMFLKDVVYEVEDYRPCEISKARNVGYKAVMEMREVPEFTNIGEEKEDKLGPEVHLLTMLGICLARCQQIEHYIANSFLLGISKKQKIKYKTIKDLINGWKRKTLGNMLLCMQEAYEIHPVLKANFELFLEMRNQLVHGITTNERYDIETYWGQQELLAFLSFFDICSRMVRKAFKATFHASLQYGILYFDIDKKIIPKHILKLLKSDQIEGMNYFVEFFTPKNGCI